MLKVQLRFPGEREKAVHQVVLSTAWRPSRRLNSMDGAAK